MLGAVIVVFLAGLSLFISKEETEESTPAEVNKISDSSIGLTFEINKDFKRMDDEALKQMNPLFLYGFQPEDVENVACVVSQTKRPEPGFVSPEFLKTGAMEQIKKSNPDAQLDAWEAKDFGKDATGVLLELSYEQKGAKTKRIELVATNDLRTTFAYCYSPKSLYSFYAPTFDKFIASLEIY